MRIKPLLLLLVLAWTAPAFALDLECNLQAASYVMFKQAREALKAQVGLTPASINTNEQCQAVIDQADNFFGEYDFMGEGKSFAQCVCKSVFVGQTPLEKAMDGTISAVYSGMKSVGCSVGLGGCPPFDAEQFYQNYSGIRSQGVPYEQLRGMYGPLLSSGGLKSTSGFSDYLAECETRYQNELQQAEAARVAAENAKQLAANQDISANAAEGWQILWTSLWSGRCKDDECRAAMANLAAKRAADEAAPATLAEYGGSTTAVKNAMNAKYNPLVNFRAAISEAEAQKRQAIIDDPNQPAETRLRVMGCKNFLARQGQFLCDEAPGFEACKRYADGGSVSNCILTGTPGARYVAADAIESTLQQTGCGVRPLFSGYQCRNDTSLNMCRAYTRGGAHVSCSLARQSRPAVSGNAQ